MNTKAIIVASFSRMRNQTRLIRVSTIWIACGFFIIAILSATALAKTNPAGMPSAPGNPIVDLQQQINALEQRVSELEGASPVPQDYIVNCPSDKIADVLAQVAYTKGPVTIIISGVCQESLTIYRDNITIRGASPGAGLTPDPSEWFIFNLIGARKTRLENLTLTGSGTGLNAASGATFEASGLHVINASAAGVHLSSEASGTLSNSTIENCGRGIVTWGSGTLNVNGGEVKNSNMFGVQSAGKSYISIGGGFKVTGSSHHAVFAGGGSIEIQNAIIEDNLSAGVWAMGGGSISIVGSNTFIRRNNLGVVAWAGSVGLRNGVQVTDNDGWAGIQSTFGGHVDLEVGVMVTDNHGAGIVVNGNSSAQVSGSSIQRNTYDGIQVHDSSVVTFQAEPNVITDNGFYGINCNQTPPSVAQSWGDPGIILPNGWGGTNCPGYP